MGTLHIMEQPMQLFFNQSQDRLDDETPVKNQDLWMETTAAMNLELWNATIRNQDMGTEPTTKIQDIASKASITNENIWARTTTEDATSIYHWTEATAKATANISEFNFSTPVTDLFISNSSYVHLTLCSYNSSCTENTVASLSIGYLEIIITLLLFLVGVTGNLLTVMVMCTKYFRRMAISVTLTALALSDLIFSLMFPLNKLFIRDWFGTDVRSLSSAGCKVFFWVFRMSKMTSSWFVVLISLERFIATVFPLKAKGISTKLSNAICVGMIYVSLGTYIGVWGSYTDKMLDGKCVPNTKPPGIERLAGKV